MRTDTQASPVHKEHRVSHSLNTEIKARQHSETNNIEEGFYSQIKNKTKKKNHTYMDFWQFSFRHYTQQLGCVLNT